MNKISERINQILHHYHLNAGEFAQRLGVQKSSISHLLSGRNKPSFLFITKLIEAFPEINIKWFLTGEGEMIESKPALEQPVIAKIKKEKHGFVENEDKAHFIEQSNSKESGVNDETDHKVSQANHEVKNIIMVYDNDTFKILNKSR